MEAGEPEERPPLSSFRGPPWPQTGRKWAVPWAGRGSGGGPPLTLPATASSVPLLLGVSVLGHCPVTKQAKGRHWNKKTGLAGI